MAKILKESKIIIWDECTMAHMHIGSTWLDTERSVQWLEMLRRRNELIAGKFLPNTASHSKIDCCRWNKRLPQIIDLWRYVKKLQLTTNMRVALLNDLSAEDSNCWLSVMVVFLSMNQVDWYNFLGIFAISFHQKMSLSTKCSRTSFVTTKITNGYVSEQFWQLRTKMWMTAQRNKVILSALTLIGFILIIVEIKVTVPLTL